MPGTQFGGNKFRGRGVEILLAIISPAFKRGCTMNDIKIIAFDIFGTVVDWYGSVAREVDSLDLGVRGSEFAMAWRAGYKPAMQRVASGACGWTVIDDLHRQILDELLERYAITGLDEQAKRRLNKVWHRLDAWPDSVAGLTRLKSKYTICSLSNGNIGLLADLAKRAGLPWDCILSAEVFRKYKPDPDTYLGVARIFDVAPGEVMLAAAHHDDLAAARACGLATAYIERPTEFGAEKPKDVSARPENTVHASNIENLATQLGC